VTDSNIPAPTGPVGEGEVIVDVRDACYAVGGREIFSGISLQALKGQITAVMGPSGTGKTTLLRLITAQIHAQRGEVRLFGENLATLNRKQLFSLRRRIGMLFQNSALLTDFNVFENVAFPLREHTDLPESLIRNLVLTRLNAVGLRGAASLMPAELSGGMARRVALARAVVMDPELLIYDEPFVGLDPIARGVILRLVQQLNRSLGITSIIVSHDVSELAKITDRAYLMAAGKIVAEGTPAELAASQSPIVRQFISGDPDGPSPFHYPARDLGVQLLADAPAKPCLPVPGARP
jgi:phospholipid/cholesterol/gamma-HCH transport system ATP-binding protein